MQRSVKKGPFIDAKLAAKIANTLSEEFIEENLEGKYDATTRATDFLQRQLEDLKIRVEKSEEELIAYAQAKDILNINEIIEATMDVTGATLSVDGGLVVGT